jgi:hypothetical protein
LFCHFDALVTLSINSRRAQLLSGDKIFLATTDQSGNLMVFLETLAAIEHALARSRGKKLNRDKIGDFILAFDESKLMLCVVAKEKVGF